MQTDQSPSSEAELIVLILDSCPHRDIYGQLSKDDVTAFADAILALLTPATQADADLRTQPNEKALSLSGQTSEIAGNRGVSTEPLAQDTGFAMVGATPVDVQAGLREAAINAALCLSGFAGEGITICGFADPADIYVNLTAALGMPDADDDDLAAALAAPHPIARADDVASGAISEGVPARNGSGHSQDGGEGERG